MVILRVIELFKKKRNSISEYLIQGLAISAGFDNETSVIQLSIGTIFPALLISGKKIYGVWIIVEK